MFMELKDMRNEIELFAMAMETTMSRHDKEKGNSWKWCDIEFLKDKLLEEFDELQKTGDKHELVDIANVCMMLFNRKLWKINDIVIEPEQG